MTSFLYRQKVTIDVLFKFNVDFNNSSLVRFPLLFPFWKSQNKLNYDWQLTVEISLALYQIKD